MLRLAHRSLELESPSLLPTARSSACVSAIMLPLRLHSGRRCCRAGTAALSQGAEGARGTQPPPSTLFGNKAVERAGEGRPRLQCSSPCLAIISAEMN